MALSAQEKMKLQLLIIKANRKGLLVRDLTPVVLKIIEGGKK